MHVNLSKTHMNNECSIVEPRLIIKKEKEKILVTCYYVIQCAIYLPIFSYILWCQITSYFIIFYSIKFDNIIMMIIWYQIMYSLV